MVFIDCIGEYIYIIQYIYIYNTIYIKSRKYRYILKEIL